MTEAASREWFDRVYTETLPDVRRIAYAILRFYPDLKGEADDLIQETYLRMYRAREQLYDRQEIIKWLVVTLKNLTSNRLRVRKTYIKHNIVNADRETLLEFCSSNQYENVDHAFIDEDREQLNKIAEQLGADKLELLSEYYLDKVPLSELAKRENISTNAMKMRISRLRKKCVEILVVVLLLNTLLLKGHIYWMIHTQTQKITETVDADLSVPSGYYDVWGEAVVQGMTEMNVFPALPQIIPDGYAYVSSLNTGLDGLFAEETYTFANPDGQFFDLIVRYDYQDDMESARHVQKEIPGTEVIDRNGFKIALAQNYDGVSATWISENCQIRLTGTCSMEELKMMIDSI